jgi:hypothetical protein
VIKCADVAALCAGRQVHLRDAGAHARATGGKVRLRPGETISRFEGARRSVEDKDTRGQKFRATYHASFRAQFGMQAQLIELDAMEPDEMPRLVRNAIPRQMTDDEIEACAEEAERHAAAIRRNCD